MFVLIQIQLNRELLDKFYTIDRRAIHLGLRGIILRKYVNEYIYKINDISENVSMWREQIKEGTFDVDLLPKEEI